MKDMYKITQQLSVRKVRLVFKDGYLFQQRVMNVSQHKDQGSGTADKRGRKKEYAVGVSRMMPIHPHANSKKWEACACHRDPHQKLPDDHDEIQRLSVLNILHTTCSVPSGKREELCAENQGLIATL